MRYLTEDIKDFYESLREESDTEVLAEKLNTFTAEKSNLQYIWLLRDFYRKLGDEQLEKYPFLLAAMAALASCEGNLEKAREYVERIEPNTIARVFAQIEMPYTTDEELIALSEKVKDADLSKIPQISLTVGRPSIVNGYRDFTFFFIAKEDNDEISHLMNNLYGEERGELIQSLIKAENYYQRNELYEALVEVLRVTPKIKKTKDYRILFSALFLEIETLLMSGEIRTTTLKMEEIRKQMLLGGCDEYIPNLAALDAWTAMYDGEYARVYRWMDESAPADDEEFCMLNLFQYLVKMRVYLIEERHFAVLALGAKLLPLLSEGGRVMDMCHVYLLLAMNEHAMGKREQAFDTLENAIKTAEERRYDRLIADEGKRMYDLLCDYADERGKTPYLQRVIDMSYKVSLDYPKYLNVVKLTLSDKELVVLKLLETDMKTKEIAESLGLSPETVKSHKKKIYKKLGVGTKSDALIEGKRMGLI